MTITPAERQWLENLTRQTMRDVEGQPLPQPEPRSHRQRYMDELNQRHRFMGRIRIPDEAEARAMLERYLRQQDQNDPSS